MRFVRFAAALSALLPCLAFGQTAPAAHAPGASAPALEYPDAKSPENAGRAALSDYLDKIAEQDLAARRAVIAKITTREQAVARQKEVRAKLLELMGGNFEKTPLNAKVLGSTAMDGFHIEKIVYESQPNFFVTALLYLPDAKTGKLPAIVMAPGHGATGKASDYAMASTFARNGFAVLSYDPIGQGERLQYPDPDRPGQSLAARPTGEHGEAGLQPTLIGDAVARYFGWDGIRAVDYLVSRPEIDAERIGAFGCSGGGAMTALLGAADVRVHAIATACYITSFDTLLPAIGPQDAEQSTPNFIASGFDFPDWIELAAPRPYAVVGTVGDMFPWKGLLASATEARRFYSLFDPAAAGTPTGNPLPPTPTGPVLNPDTSNTIAASAPFQVIAGIGGHGNLRPLTAQIVSFFLVNLAHSTAAPVVPPMPVAGAPPAAPDVPAGALQVTPTGQVSTSYPDCETVHTLNLKRAAVKMPKGPRSVTLPQLQAVIRDVTHATVKPGDPAPAVSEVAPLTAPPEGKANFRHRFTLTTAPGIKIEAEFYRPPSGRHRALLILRDSLDSALEMRRAGDIRNLRAIADAGTAVLVIAPRPSPPGNEEIKAPVLGPFYLTELRAELVGKTLLGMRVDDVIGAINYLVTSDAVDPRDITADASGHLGTVLLHAAVLDPRLRQVSVNGIGVFVSALDSYRNLLNAPLPVDAPQDILPGVLLHYDIPDLNRVLGARISPY